jgi:hypothetical protein
MVFKSLFAKSNAYEGINESSYVKQLKVKTSIDSFFTLFQGLSIFSR